MFRPLAASFQSDLARRTAASPASGAQPNRLRLQWSVTDGRPMTRWQRQPRTGQVAMKVRF